METPVLRRLRDLTDFEVADDNPDVRGWTVRGSDGQALGTVYELIVEPEAMKVRYLDVELDASFHINEHENHILLPIGAASLDEDGDNVFVPALNAETVLSYPPYVEIQITREYEEAMLRALGKEAAPANPRFYEQDSFDADSFYSRRRAS
ncbi:PRC-barrel domain-containing protein [Microvirga sp. STS02]|uniref:PRC-barrel domain-containing protein n=1 Tax=Hymenobacter negativus TaxID=2795026 RepID=A0ABS0Q9D1_9BACT|nr:MULTISPECIES: PRC-barrel domain-containing protein [Bacteria]MBH8559195.1 PRC-barrel domain-containing protein [Hymenobacter negativus]MBH8569942.1 PRC-barrel domain-containing protein [Hymenobacter negativus]MBR7209681.1 PRC-barrel domain-containing protein [Microvirga sp. STS02]